MKHYADGKVARLDGYFCLDGGATKVTTCPEPNRISRRELVDILLPLVRRSFAVYLDKPARFMEYGRERIAEAEKNAAVAMRETENKIFRLREEESEVYMDYRAGKLLQQEYAAYKKKQEGRLADLEMQKASLEGKIRELGKLSDRYLAAIKALIRFRSASVLDREMAEAFFSKISVYPGKRVEVTFTFTPGCMGGVE